MKNIGVRISVYIRQRYRNGNNERYSADIQPIKNS